MSGLVRELISRADALEFVSRTLGFPWETREQEVPLEEAVSKILAEDLTANAPYPPYDRSLRDGYAVKSSDITGSSPSFPVFLKLAGSIPMGVVPAERLITTTAMEIFTGGILPDGADSVVMMEDTVVTGNLLEVRRSVQKGEHVIRRGEEVETGHMLLKRGSILDFRSFGVLSTFGYRTLKIIDLKIGVISTGDEVLPVDTYPLPPGSVRDVNTWTLFSLLEQNGFNVKLYGIIPDDKLRLSLKIKEAYMENDIVIISGGSSVSMRDYCSELMEDIPSPGLLVRGIRIRPGKPTLIAGSMSDRKLVIGLPGHPLSCSIVACTVLIPLLSRLISSDHIIPWKTLYCPLMADLHGKTGIEEFIPFRFDLSGGVVPEMAKSGYINAMYGSYGLIRLSESVETVRKGEEVEAMLW